MIFGYARVSTTGQNLDAQLDALKAAGAERIFQEKVTGATRARAELDAMLLQTRQDDVVVVTMLDRLARSLSQLIEIVTALNDLGYIDLEQKTLQPLGNPFGPRLSPMS